MVSKFVKAFYKVADPVLTAIANPIKSVKAAISKKTTFKDVQREFFQQSKAKQSFDFATSVLTLGSLGGAGLAAKAGKLGPAIVRAGTSIKRSGPKLVASGIKSLVPSTTKGKLVAAVAAPAAIGALTSSPTLRKATVKTLSPVENIRRGKELGGILEKSPQKKDISNVVAKGALLGGGAALAAGGLILGKNILDKKSKVLPITKPDQKPLTPQTNVQQTPAASAPTFKAVPGEVKKTTKRKRKARKKAPTTTVKLINNNNIAIAT